MQLPVAPERAQEWRDTVLQVLFCYPEVPAGTGNKRCKNYLYNYNNDAPAGINCML